MEIKKYEALRFISKVQVVMGWIIGGLGCIFSLILINEFSLGILSIIFSIFVGLVLIAMGELIKLLIDIDENTRNSNTNKVQLTNSTNAKSNKNNDLSTEHNFDGVRVSISNFAKDELKKK